MKKLDKLEINPEKIMRNEELVILRGGYDPEDCHCMCYDGMTPMGLMAAMNQQMCYDNCHDANPNWTGTWSCI